MGLGETDVSAVSIKRLDMVTEKNKADVVLISKSLFTANKRVPRAGGIAVRGNRIVAVGSVEDVQNYIGADTRVIDCGSKTVMPGLIDSHMHFALASTQRDEDFCVVVEGLHSKEEALARISEFAKSHPTNPWIYGWGWDAAMWEVQDLPTKTDLDAIDSQRPICISHFTMHTSWCNSKALELAGITKDTPDPEGGVIVRDENGEPTGVLLEHPASCLVADMALFNPHLDDSIRKMLARFRSLGITSIGDMFPRDITNDNVYETYKALEGSGELTCRINFFPSLLDVPAAAAMRNEYCSDKLRVAGVKQILDGIVEAHTARMIDPYEGEPDNYGEYTLSPEEYEKHVMEADAAGLAVRTHCIGDQAARTALDVYERVQTKHGAKGLRNCIEHAEAITDEDMKRLHALDVNVSVQPLHATFGTVSGFYDTCIGADRAAHCWRFRKLLDSGAHVGFSTDFPAAPTVEPMMVLQAAVNRRMPDGFPEQGMHPEYAVTLGEALQCMTQGSSYVVGSDAKVGTLQEGKLADIIVLDRDLFAVEDTMELNQAHVMLTMIDGDVVYEAD